MHAEDGQRLGLVQHVVDDPVHTATELAAKIAARPRLAVRMSKELLNGSIGAGGSLANTRGSGTVAANGAVQLSGNARLGPIPGRLEAQLDRYDDLENDVDFLAQFSTRSQNVDFALRLFKA